MTILSLRADCGRCAALCCVALAFDRSALFAIDKPAGVRCTNLDGRGECRVHARRETEGFAGCVSYDCMGAGQRVVQDFFGGHSWLADGALLMPMMEAFRVARIAHQYLHLLDRLVDLAPEAAAQRLALSAAMKAAGVSAAEVGAVAKRIAQWLRDVGRERVSVGRRR